MGDLHPIFRSLIKFLASAVFVYVLLVLAMYFGQRHMMYVVRDKPDIKEAHITGLEEIKVQTADGLELFGWYKKALADKPVIVWFHGNASTVLWQSYRSVPYLLEKYGSLFVEYRGYSGNPGQPTEENLYKDGRAFINWLKDQGVPENNIILYAESLGTGIAVQMATEYPNIRALVLEASYSSTVDVGSHHYWFVPVQLLMKDRYESLSKIGKVKTPVVIVHGDNDRIIPYVYGEKLFEAANRPKTMITVEGGRHNNLGTFEFAPQVLEILEKIEMEK